MMEHDEIIKHAAEKVYLDMGHPFSEAEDYAKIQIDKYLNIFHRDLIENIIQETEARVRKEMQESVIFDTYKEMLRIKDEIENSFGYQISFSKDQKTFDDIYELVLDILKQKHKALSQANHGAGEKTSDNNQDSEGSFMQPQRIHGQQAKPYSAAGVKLNEKDMPKETASASASVNPQTADIVPGQETKSQETDASTKLRVTSRPGIQSPSSGEEGNNASLKPSSRDVQSQDCHNRKAGEVTFYPQKSPGNYDGKVGA